MGFYGSPYDYIINCYLMRSRALLITPLHVTVVVSFWGHFGIESSVVCTLHTEHRSSGPKSMCVSHEHLCISTSESVYMGTLYYSFKFNTAFLSLLLALHVWVVQQN